MARNKYTHSIELKKIDIKNTDRATFIQHLNDLPYRGYEVEELANGNKIVITKPGGKSVFGRPKKEDFLVFIYNPTDQSLWQISHNQIFADVEKKAEESVVDTLRLIDLLERTLHGEEPNDFLQEILALHFTTGETAETLIKVYKWMWGQEDVNYYPKHEGRMMSWHSFEDLRNRLK